MPGSLCGPRQPCRSVPEPEKLAGLGVVGETGDRRETNLAGLRTRSLRPLRAADRYADRHISARVRDRQDDLRCFNVEPSLDALADGVLLSGIDTQILGNHVRWRLQPH